MAKQIQFPDWMDELAPAMRMILARTGGRVIFHLAERGAGERVEIQFTLHAQSAAELAMDLFRTGKVAQIAAMR